MTKQQAIDHFGSAKALADALKVTPQSVSQWEKIPARRQYELEKITVGELRPDRTLVPSAA